MTARGIKLLLIPVLTKEGGNLLTLKGELFLVERLNTIRCSLTTLLAAW